MSNKLFCIILVFKGDGTIRFEHGLTVATDEEAARLTAVEVTADGHPNEVLFSSDALEITEDVLKRLIEAMKGEPRTVDACIVSSYRVKS